MKTGERLDRIFLKSNEWKVTSCEIIGKEEIQFASPPVTHNGQQLHLWPSDHYGYAFHAFHT